MFKVRFSAFCLSDGYNCCIQCCIHGNKMFAYLEILLNWITILTKQKHRLVVASIIVLGSKFDVILRIWSILIGIESKYSHFTWVSMCIRHICYDMDFHTITIFKQKFKEFEFKYNELFVTKYDGFTTEWYVYLEE